MGTGNCPTFHQPVDFAELSNYPLGRTKIQFQTLILLGNFAEIVQPA